MARKIFSLTVCIQFWSEGSTGAKVKVRVEVKYQKVDFGARLPERLVI